LTKNSKKCIGRQIFSLIKENLNLVMK